VLVCFDHVARFIVNANQCVMLAAVKLRVADCIADRERKAGVVPKHLTVLPLV
jgi:hypothetical protein